MIKHSKCCNVPLVELHSSNTKMCTGCGKEVDWPLSDGQTPTFRKPDGEGK